jgi:hypothetical protein
MLFNFLGFQCIKARRLFLGVVDDSRRNDNRKSTIDSF